MKLRCSPGILALVINEAVPSQNNVGRLVQVLGRVTPNAPQQLPSWSIRPVSGSWYSDELSPADVGPGYGTPCVEHPDAGLLPLDIPCTLVIDAEHSGVRRVPHVDWDQALDALLQKWPTDS
jgi:hypothetical protein